MEISLPGLTKLEPFTLPLDLDGVRVKVAGMYRAGTGIPIVFLHGFGSTKEDYADVIQQVELADRPILAYDAPGCGATSCSDLNAISVHFLVAVAKEVLASQGIERFHLVGHSMGGLTALLLADQDPARVVSFSDIEGNVAPEDCFLSRQIISHSHPDPEGFFKDFQERVWKSRFYSSSLYAASLPHKVRPGAVRPIFESMVDLSDHGGLMDRFLALPFARMYMYGVQNNTLSYLPLLAEKGIELAEIPRSGHFPMYSNATEMWDRLTAFFLSSEQA
ncbi:Pimeloyl-ACP methyl ester carboxylesterase [Arthrobacter sp. cf158]|nr:Pimeloyl-ACP methyl ester carboxylesterase [Arthrobacter sp. cf158]